MILCVILLVSSLLLTWKVCHLNRRLKMLSSNGDLVSNTEYWMGNAKKNKSNSKEEAKESSLLMADFNNTQENAGSDATKEEGGKVNMDGQMGDENEEEKGDTGKSDEASAAGNIEEMPVTDAENASSSRPPEGTTDSQVTKDGAASSSEGREEPQDVV
uniref:uncharacterized protein LOC109959391 isoform X2 n=1 Tax=Monopterus albus TaxID=43700 RepID=UPI0009B31772|nr:uncharacterized protein LOC109959391 isoform X2 [Monopterus albus]